MEQMVERVQSDTMLIVSHSHAMVARRWPRLQPYFSRCPNTIAAASPVDHESLGRGQ
jgi:hypothetical protein